MVRYTREVPASSNALISAQRESSESARKAPLSCSAHCRSSSEACSESSDYRISCSLRIGFVALTSQFFPTEDAKSPASNGPVMLSWLNCTNPLHHSGGRDVIFSAIAPTLLLLGGGIALHRRAPLDERFCTGLSWVSYWVFTPSLFITAISSTDLSALSPRTIAFKPYSPHHDRSGTRNNHWKNYPSRWTPNYFFGPGLNQNQHIYRFDLRVRTSRPSRYRNFCPSKCRSRPLGKRHLHQ